MEQKSTMRTWACLLAVVGGVGAMGAQQPAAILGLTVQAQSSSCGMQMNDTPPVFCETFDTPHPVTNRSGQLDGTLWGVSRQRGQGTHWANATLDGCNGPQAASPVGATDVIICNGQLREVTNDDHDITSLALYPKQPFDFAGRTGTISFDVSNDTTGIHGAWPEVWITDQPVPTPFYHSDCAFCTLPRHAFGIRFAADRGSCPNGWRADSAIAVRNYVPENRGNWHSWETPPTGFVMQETGCAALSSGPNGGLSHVEIRISQNAVDVYASDAGTQTPLHHINSITNLNLSFTKGLVWIEDGHYNAEKAVELNGIPSQKNHTYTWDNVAFDGPATYRDLSFDVLENNVLLSPGVFDLGWPATPSAPAHVFTLPITTAQINAATGALLTFNFGIYTTPTTFTYVVNGHPNTVTSPLTNPAHGMQSLAVPVPKDQLLPGQQDLLLSASTNVVMSNVNVVLVAAAAVPAAGDPPPPPPPPPPTVCAQPVFTPVVGTIYHLGTCFDGSMQHPIVIP